MRKQMVSEAMLQARSPVLSCFSEHLKSLKSATAQISLHLTGCREGHIAQFSLSSTFTFDLSWARLSSCFGVNLGRKNLFSPRI